MAESRKKKSFLSQLFPAYSEVAPQNLGGLSLPPGTAIYENFTQDGTQLGTSETAEDGELELYALPKNRLAKYDIFKTMALDPTIDSALKMHITHALSAKADTGEIISIESIGDTKDPIVEDLRNTIMPMLNANCHAWAWNAAIYGCWFTRVYGAPNRGIELLRSDYYTHPRFINIYEQAGNVCGYVSAHQTAEKGGISLIEPWNLVPFRIPIWQTQEMEPIRIDGSLFDLGSDDYRSDAVAEAQNYGTSLIETAYLPWTDLLNAILSLNMSRKNASKLERLIGVNMGKLNATEAAKYLNIVAGQVQKVDKANTLRSLKKGYVPTVVNHLFPVVGDGRARLDISTMEGQPNIEAIQDVLFHVNRLGGALGVDPSLLGFGENLSGGLGDGGFFRVSVLAAQKAEMLRSAMLTGFQQLCDIHIAYKHKKVFLPGEKPYRIVFNSVSTAIEREEMENREGRIALATGMAQVVGLIDQEWITADRNAFLNHIFTDILKTDEEKFKLMFPKEKGEKADELALKAAEQGAAAPPQQVQPGAKFGDEDGDGLLESARIKQYIDSLYG